MTQEAIKLHDGYAAEWDDRYKSGGFRRRAKFVAEHIEPKLPNGGTWLDAGCGSGFFTRAIAKRGRTVLGVDGSSEMVSAAQLRAEGLPVAFETIDDLQTLDLGPRVFDGAICLSVLEYLKHPQRAVRSISSSLSIGAIAVFSVPNRKSVVRKVQGLSGRLPGRAPPKYLAYSTFSLDVEKAPDWFAVNGFRVVETDHFDPILPSYAHAAFAPSLAYYILRKVHTLNV
ncbi:MAG: methyltransferase domain-containing protein [Pseudomonadota bacterium]